MRRCLGGLFSCRWQPQKQSIQASVNWIGNVRRGSHQTNLPYLWSAPKLALAVFEQSTLTAAPGL